MGRRDHRGGRPGQGGQDGRGGRGHGSRGGRRERGREGRNGRRQREEPPDRWSRLLPPGPDNDFLEKTACPACANTSASISRLGPTLLRVCRHCGLGYISPRLAESVRETMLRQGAGGLLSERNIALRHLMADRLQSMHREMLPMEEPKTSAALLDVGSSWGHFLQLCRPHYASVEGLEISQDKSAVARERFDVKITNLDVLKDHWQGRHHIITAWDFIERSPHPVQFLEWAYAHLHPGGQLILSTPNMDSLYRRLLGKHWFHYAPTRNLAYFSPKVMRDFLRQAGFETITIQTSGRSRLRERWNRHNQIDRSLDARDRWIETLRTREAVERERSEVVWGRKNLWRKLWEGLAWPLMDFLTERGLGDEMRVYANKGPAK